MVRQRPLRCCSRHIKKLSALIVPTNGPNNGLTDDQRGLSWSLTHKNVTFVAADQYFNFDPTFAGGTTPWSGYHSLDRAWVAQQFQAGHLALQNLHSA